MSSAIVALCEDVSDGTKGMLKKDAGDSELIAQALGEGVASLAAMPGHLIRRSHQIAVGLFQEELGPLDVTPVQFAALMAIGGQPGIEAARISELIAFDRSTLGDVLDRLTSKGWVERRPSALDRRVKTITLTKAGETLLREATPAVARAQERILQPLAEEDREHYMNMMRKLVGLHTGEARYGS